jgi:CheY-like chemotaxis protein
VGSTYAIRREVVRTETGVVFEARDLMLDRLVAIKLAWRDPGMPSLLPEARRCAQVRDACAVAVHGIGSHHGVEYVVAERVGGSRLATMIDGSREPGAYLARLRSIVAAVARAHEFGVAVGEVSGATVQIYEDGRAVLGRLSLSQVPAFGRHGQVLAPEVARGEVAPEDPAAAEAIDLYGLGCLAFELATGAPPFATGRGSAGLDVARDRDAEWRRHAELTPPRLADLRPDLPDELSDLIEWLLAKAPAARPASARDVLAQLDAVIERTAARSRTLRVLVVDDDSARGRWVWSLARRALAGVTVETAADGTDAAHKLHRDRPDLIFVDAALRGVMNAIELCMYARGLESEVQPQIAILGEVQDRDRALLASSAVTAIPRTIGLANAVIERVRRAAAAGPRRRKPRTISG